MRTRQNFIIVLIAFQSAITFAAEPDAQPPPRPIPAIERVLIISIDGLRPDVLLRARAPYIRTLMDNGSFTFWARTTAVAVTLPSHVSMLTGVIPQRHGIHWNDGLPLTTAYYPRVPTIFELAKKAGYHTALVAGKTKFDLIPTPGTVDWIFTPTSITAEQSKVDVDELVTENVLRILSEHRPEMMFVHFATVDTTGHDKGWGTSEQLAAAERIDGYIGRILDTEKTLQFLDHTAIIISSDHGGAGGNHGEDDPRSRHIPWILSGPGIRKNYDLTRIAELEVNTYDTFSTACYLLGIKAPGRSDGKPILQAIEEKVSAK